MKPHREKTYEDWPEEKIDPQIIYIYFVPDVTGVEEAGEEVNSHVSNKF